MPTIADARDALAHRDFELCRSHCAALIEAGEDAANAHLVHGLSLLEEKRYESAGDYFIGCGVRDSGIYINASIAYQKAGLEAKEMSALYMLLSLPYGDHDTFYRKLARWAIESKRPHIARRALLGSYLINSDDIAIIQALATACKDDKQYRQALPFCREALARATNDSERAGFHAIMAGAYKDLGEQQLAREHFQTSFELSKSPTALSNLIMFMQYTDGVSLEEFYHYCRVYSQRFLRHLPRYQFDESRMRPERLETGLHIAFVSGDLVAHSLANLIVEPIRRLKSMGSQHTYTCYSSRPADAEDRISTIYKDTLDNWVCVHGMDDATVAQRIYDDGVDILIELAGHTAYNRLPVFGYKPAPVQVGWVSGMMTPSALETIPYFFTDQWMRPPSAERVCSERLIDLPAAYTYFPITEAPAVADLPADTNGHITFGSFNNPCKISDHVVDVWAAAMRVTPTSHMHIKVYGIDHERKLRKQFLARGITGDRLQFVYSLPKSSDVMAYYTEKIDVVLDTFPCAGCLTSAEALWMGVPVMTLVGDTFLYRQTWTILNQIGLHERLAAFSDTEFAEKVKDLCAYENRGALRDMRRTLRGRMEFAPIRQPEMLTQGLLDGFALMWREQCERFHGLDHLRPSPEEEL